MLILGKCEHGEAAVAVAVAAAVALSLLRTGCLSTPAT
jgi:hypothetical protein